MEEEFTLLQEKEVVRGNSGDRKGGKGTPGTTARRKIGSWCVARRLTPGGKLDSSASLRSVTIKTLAGQVCLACYTPLTEQSEAEVCF